MEGYNFTKNIETIEYHFTTVNGIFYSVKFSLDETFNSVSHSEEFKNVFQIILAKISNDKEPLDKKVSVTIKNIIMDFLHNQKNSILYFCSYFDQKELKRFNTFNRWYEYSETKDHINKIDNLIKIENVLFYTSLILHEKNPQKKEIIELFDSLEELLNREK